MQKVPLTERVLSRMPDLPVEVVDPENFPHGELGGKQSLYLKEYKGKFLRFCPGTRYYHCCGYRIIHIGEGCPMACSYCILQAYFQDNVLKVWANQNDLFDELGKAFSADISTRYRVGTGEFTDSLALEAVTGYSRDLVEFLGDYPNVCWSLNPRSSIFHGWTWSSELTDCFRLGPSMLLLLMSMRSLVSQLSKSVLKPPAPVQRPDSGSACILIPLSVLTAGVKAMLKSSI